MLKHIIGKEILENLTSPKFVFSFILCTVLILVSVYTGLSNYQVELAEYHGAVSLNMENLERQTTWQNLGNATKIVTRPPQILSTIVAGIQDAGGRNAEVGFPKLTDSKYASNPVSAIYGPLDLVLIVKIILSLFAILFTFDAISGEKEKGTLKLALSNQVPRDQLILGKTIGSFISLLLPLVISLLMGLILLKIYPDILFSAEDWTRLGLIFLCFLLYLSVFFNLGMFISSRTHRSSGSLFVLLFIWVLLIFIIPKTAVVISRQILPIPSIHEVSAERGVILQEIQDREVPKAQERLMNWQRENITEPGVPPGPELQREFRDLVEEVNHDLMAIINARSAELIADYQAKRRRQQMLAFNLSRISPPSALTFSTMRLGKTGVEAHERFANSVRTYESILGDWFMSKMSENMQFSPQAESPKPVLDGMPQYESVPEGLSDSLYAVRYDLGIMILLNILLFAGAFVSFLRYDVR